MIQNNFSTLTFIKNHWRGVLFTFVFLGNFVNYFIGFHKGYNEGRVYERQVIEEKNKKAQERYNEISSKRPDTKQLLNSLHNGTY